IVLAAAQGSQMSGDRTPRVGEIAHEPAGEIQQVHAVVEESASAGKIEAPEPPLRERLAVPVTRPPAGEDDVADGALAEQLVRLPGLVTVTMVEPGLQAHAAARGGADHC